MWMATMTDNYLKLSRYNTYEAQAAVSNIKIAGVDQQAPWLDLRASLSRNGSYPLCHVCLVKIPVRVLRPTAACAPHLTILVGGARLRPAAPQPPAHGRWSSRACTTCQFLRGRQCWCLLAAALRTRPSTVPEQGSVRRAHAGLQQNIMALQVLMDITGGGHHGLPTRGGGCGQCCAHQHPHPHRCQLCRAGVAADAGPGAVRLRCRRRRPRLSCRRTRARTLTSMDGGTSSNGLDACSRLGGVADRSADMVEVEMPRIHLIVNARAADSNLHFLAAFTPEDRKVRDAFAHAEAFAHGIASVLEQAVPEGYLPTLDYAI